MLTHAALALMFFTPGNPVPRAASTPPRVATERVWHLGDDATPEWPEAPADPEGHRLAFTFTGAAFDGDGVLVCQQRHVNNPWHIEINGQRIATLKTISSLGDQFYLLPAGVIRDGDNSFELVGGSLTDDITFGAVRYYPTDFRTVFDLRRVSVTVTDASGHPLPARVTITDDADALAKVYYAERLMAAVRPGVVYTADGVASFEVPLGSYHVYAARGTEWSMDHAELLVDGEQTSIALSLRRELDTTGFIAADTHVHTLTYSGHGDSSVEERMVTLAGEGVELAIATDHNHNTDYRPMQLSMNLGEYFTPVVGNEITTPIGHLNAFPLNPDDDVPPYDLHDIVAIVDGARAAGAEAVILNHPRWPSHDNSPHGHMRLDHASGDWVGTWACTFDAIELINSQTEELEPMLLFRDWFALLNRGERLAAVGSSDSHTVGGVVGQGRTYVQSSTDDPSQIDISEAAFNIANGRSSISMGIFADMQSAGRSVMGETTPPVPLTVRITAPSWVAPHTLTVYANGTPVFTHAIDAESVDGPLDILVPIPEASDWPMHDCWVVAIIDGAGVGGVWWPQLNDYTLAATNPVFFDVDGDGQYTDPRALATAYLEEHGTSVEAVMPLLQKVDAAVAVQLLRQIRLAWLQQTEDNVAALIRSSGSAEWTAWFDWVTDND